MSKNFYRLFIFIFCSPFIFIGCSITRDTTYADTPQQLIGEREATPGYPTFYQNANDGGYPPPEMKTEATLAEFPKPETGKAVVTATIYSKSLQSILPNSLVYLTPASGKYRDELYPVLGGPRSEVGDIVGFTDEFGNVIIEDIQPGNYFMIINFQPDWVVANESENSSEAMLFVLESGRVYNLGRIYIP